MMHSWDGKTPKFIIVALSLACAIGMLVQPYPSLSLANLVRFVAQIPNPVGLVGALFLAVRHIFAWFVVVYHPLVLTKYSVHRVCNKFIWWSSSN